MSAAKSSRVAEYLEHILEAIERATMHVKSANSVVEFERDTKAQDAVVRNIEVIGEAANKIAKVAPEYVAAHNEVPWNLMRAMRNKIIHDYFDVDYGVVWQTVQNDLPILAAQIKALLAEQP